MDTIKMSAPPHGKDTLHGTTNLSARLMSLVNTNYDYLSTMGIAETSPLVAVLVSVYYLGCAAGSVVSSKLADRRGRKPGIFLCLSLTVLGNLIMFVAGLGYGGVFPFWVMLVGRVVMGLGVGGIDSVIPVYSSELNDEDARGRAMAQEFQANILGLNIAFGLNLAMTRGLGKFSQWAWRIPIIFMQTFPLFLALIFHRLPESPRWLLAKHRDDDARAAIAEIFDEADVDAEFQKLKEASEEESSKPVSYADMLIVGGDQFHPTAITIMGQVNQALTGYGCVSVYGPQTFELLGFSVLAAENITQANYISYFFMMTLAWLLIDVVGRRKLMLWCSAILVGSFLLLALFGGLEMEEVFDVPGLAVAIPGVIVLFIATAAFGVGWLPQPWLIPTEIYPSKARAKGAAISVVVWGFMNFAVTFLSPILFNNFKYWIFVVFAITNATAGVWTWVCPPPEPLMGDH